MSTEKLKENLKRMKTVHSTLRRNKIYNSQLNTNTKLFIFWFLDGYIFRALKIHNASEREREIAFPPLRVQYFILNSSEQLRFCFQIPMFPLAKEGKREREREIAFTSRCMFNISYKSHISTDVDPYFSIRSRSLVKCMNK